MTQALLSNKNSAWGVIVNPIGSNVYREILSFDNENLKDEFINKYLFNKGEDYKDLIKKQPNISFTQTTALNATFRVNYKDYPNETINSLLNKDFAIIKHNDEFLFYAISGVVTGQTIQYECELDIFFTHDIKNMFNKTSQSTINRAFIDRFDKQLKPILKGDIANGEELETMYGKEKFTNIKPKRLELKISNDETIDNYTSSTSWLCMFFKSKTETTILADELTNDTVNNIIELPYEVSIAPIDVGWRVDGNIWRANELYKKYKDNVDLLAVYIVPHIPFKILNSQTQTVINEFDPAYQIVSKPKADIEVNTKNIPLGYENPYTTYTDGKAKFAYRKLRINGTYELSLPKFQLDELEEIFEPKIDKDIEAKPQIETKILFEPFTEIEIANPSSENFKLDLRDTQDYNIKLKQLNGFAAEQYKIYSYVESGYYQNAVINKYRMVEENNYTLPVESDAWKQYIASHKVSAISGQATTILGAIAGVGTSAIAGGLTAGAGGAALGGISSLIGGASNVADYYAKRADIKNTPKQLSKTSSNLNIDYSAKNLNYYYLVKEMKDNEKEAVSNYFRKNAYNLNSKIDNINKYLKNRYYYNFIQAKGTFENMSIPISAEVKQTINDTLEKGVTVWHIRDLTTFKGVKNYEVNNIEMSLV